MELNKITLSNIASGAMEEKFQYLLQKVLKNIEDVNTKSTESRQIFLKINIIPGENRKTASFRIEGAAKLSEADGVSGLMFLAKKGDDYISFEQDPGQLTFNDETKSIEEKIEDKKE